MLVLWQEHADAWRRTKWEQKSPKTPPHGPFPAELKKLPTSLTDSVFTPTLHTVVSGVLTSLIRSQVNPNVAAS